MTEKEKMTSGNGDLLCYECVDDHCITCDHCGEVIYTDDCITDDHIWLCTDCYEDYYRRCESCNRIITFRCLIVKSLHQDYRE